MEQINWTGDYLLNITKDEQTWIMRGITDKGDKFTGIGAYVDGKLVSITEVEPVYQGEDGGTE